MGLARTFQLMYDLETMKWKSGKNQLYLENNTFVVEEKKKHQRETEQLGKLFTTHITHIWLKDNT